MKKVLVIDESQLFRDYLKKKLEDYGFEVDVAVSGLDGSSKLRTSLPDLLITDYNLSRKSAVELLKEKHDNPNARDIPVIMASAKVDRDALMGVAGYNVRKFLTKPIRVDALLKAVSETLKVPVSIDTTPCIVEAHVNEDIMFIEVAQGLNREKIDLLRYKIHELLDLYELKSPRILVLMTSIEVSTADSIKLQNLFSSVLEVSGSSKRNVKVLTRSAYVREYLESRSEFSGIDILDNLEDAMDGLLSRKVGGPILEPGPDVRDDVLGTSVPKKKRGESINMRFQEEEHRPSFELSSLGDSTRISIVDDDEVIQELIRSSFADTRVQIHAYGNGRAFLDDEGSLDSDLVFLDLMMPEMNGFQVLEALKEKNLRLPIIVLSALSKRETVVQALKMGVSSYIIKPLKPHDIRNKASEILGLNF
ncbi:MAG: response regulator [Alkalispirochaeta sp.]